GMPSAGGCWRGYRNRLCRPRNRTDLVGYATTWRPSGSMTSHYGAVPGKWLDGERVPPIANVLRDPHVCLSVLAVDRLERPRADIRTSSDSGCDQTNLPKPSRR